jgi:hypothetical protein
MCLAPRVMSVTALSSPANDDVAEARGAMLWLSLAGGVMLWLSLAGDSVAESTLTMTHCHCLSYTGDDVLSLKELIRVASIRVDNPRGHYRVSWEAQCRRQA